MKLDRRELTPFDSLVNQIRVPEIDPRQYIVIYEWQPSNVDKSRPAIRDKYRMREVTRYNELMGLKMTELLAEKKAVEQSLDEYNKEVSQAKRALNSLSNITVPLAVQVEHKSTQRLYYEAEEDSPEEDSLLTRMEELMAPYQPDEYKIDSVSAVIRSSIAKKSQAEASINKVMEEIDYFRKLRVENEYKRDYLKWQYGKGRDTSRFNGFKPFDFFDKVENAYEGLQENYVEYYNEVAWRNAGTPDWEPIWWLNQYPWPNMDYRNIDLLDQDYRDSRFALIPYQKYSVIDNKAVLRIVFDKTQLARNENFKGSIGIQASLYDGPGDGEGKAGDAREIEINPYSVIGEARRSIGLLNRPAGELADNLIVLLIEANNISNKASELSGRSTSSLQPGQAENLNFYKSSLESIQRILEKHDTSRTIADTTQVIELINGICTRSDAQSYLTVIDNSNFANYCYGSTLFDDNSEPRLRSTIESLITNINSSLLAAGQQRSNQRIKAPQLVEFKEELAPITTYLNYFNAEIGNTRDAFLNLIGKDKIAFDNLNTRFQESINRLDTNLVSLQTAQLSPSGRDTLNDQIKASIAKIGRILEGFTDIQGSPISFAIRKLKDTHNGGQLNDVVDDPDIYEYDRSAEKTLLLKVLGAIFRDNEMRRQLREYISEKAGEILYQDLVFGTIDLDLADANDGDMLYIRLYWDKEAVEAKDQAITNATKAEATSTTTTTDKPSSPQRDGVALYVAKFQLLERGWKQEVTPNVLLINRFNENLLPNGYPGSTSNFKPTGGTSLNWGLRNDFRTKKRIKFDPITNLPRFDRQGRLKYNKLGVFAQRTFKWLEPSFGVNFSYLDFNLNETFEIGVGPSIGLFQNAISLTTGWNLMELDQQPLYFGIGANILQLAAVPRKDRYKK